MPFFFREIALVAAKGVLLAAAMTMNAEAQDRYAAERKAMLDDIARITRETRAETGRDSVGPFNLNLFSRFNVKAACRFQVAGATVPQRSRAAASTAAAVGSAPAASSAAVNAASVRR